MSQKKFLRTPSVVITMALAVLGTIGYLITGHVPSFVRPEQLEPAGLDTNPQPCDRALEFDCHLREVQTRRRSLWTAGVPGESLLLAEANSAEDAGAIGFAEIDPRSTGSGDGQRHKNLLPLNKWDIATLIVATLGLMIAAAGGIGGGGMLVPIFILVLKFRPKYAVPLSNIAIFGGAITNTFLNTRKRHPIADRPLIDWDLILAMEPLTIGGALVGSFIQKVLPEIALTLMMVLLLLVTADRTLRKGAKAFQKESLQRKAVLNKAVVGDGAPKKMEEALLGNGQAAPASYGAAHNDEDHADDKEGNDQFPPAVLSTVIVTSPEVVEKKEMDVIAPDSSEEKISLNGPSSNGPAVSLAELLEEERKTPLAKVRAMSIIFAVLLTVNLLKGGGAFRSPLGIVCGSFAFWATSILCLVYLIAVSLVVRQYLVKRWQLKQQLNYQYVEGDIEWNPVNTLRYPFICCFAGFFAGMFGVGGGIVKGPLMLEMGVHPRVASATSAVMILYTSFTATTSFLVFGLLRVDYAVVLFFLGLFATAAGQVGTDYLVKKFGRPSFIILSIGSVVAISALLMGYNGVSDILKSRAAEEVESKAAGICEAGM